MAIEQQDELKLKIFTLTLAVLLPFSRSCEKCAYAPLFFAVQLVTVNNQMNNLHDN
jgi:hypothetical protein